MWSGQCIHSLNFVSFIYLISLICCEIQELRQEGQDSGPFGPQIWANILHCWHLVLFSLESKPEMITGSQFQTCETWAEHKGVAVVLQVLPPLCFFAVIQVLVSLSCVFLLCYSSLGDQTFVFVPSLGGRCLSPQGGSDNWQLKE